MRLNPPQRRRCSSGPELGLSLRPSPPTFASTAIVYRAHTRPASEFPWHLLVTKQFRLNAHMNSHDSTTSATNVGPASPMSMRAIVYAVSTTRQLVSRCCSWRFECALCPSKIETREALNDHQHELAEDSRCDDIATRDYFGYPIRNLLGVFEQYNKTYEINMFFNFVF